MALTLRAALAAEELRLVARCSCSRVLMTQMGFVSRHTCATHPPAVKSSQVKSRGRSEEVLKGPVVLA